MDSNRVTARLTSESASADDSRASYQQVRNQDDEDENNGTRISDERGARQTMRNFILMSVLFSANHGSVVSCLGLASARLGAIGAWQSGILYITYTASALLGATYIVKHFGARNSLLLGMGFYCAYVACFWIATQFPDNLEAQRLAAYFGAAIGGVGAGFLWTAQGAYFGQSAEDHASRLRQPLSSSTASLAGIFAFCYLSEEVALRLLSSVLLEFGIASWGTIFAIYTAVTVLSTLAMPYVYNYHKAEEGEGEIETYNAIFYKTTAAVQLLVRDPKMKYMIGLNAVFGFTAAFLNSYVNGQVVPVALDDPDSRYIGILSSWVSAVAAATSLVFGRVAPNTGKGPILILGALCFLGVVVPFVVQPDAKQFGWALLIMVYTLHGTGRATFEGTLKAMFADYFSYEKEGAFANIILQNGLSGAVGYILTFSLLCDTPSRFCVEYRNGTLHDVLTFELIVIVSALFAIVGYLRASVLYAREQEVERLRLERTGNETSVVLLTTNDEGVSA